MFFVMDLISSIKFEIFFGITNLFVIYKFVI